MRCWFVLSAASSAATVTTSASHSQASVTQSQSSLPTAGVHQSPVTSLRSPLSSSVEIPQQERRLQTWLSLGSYEDVLNSDFDYWEVRKQLMDSGMEMTRLLRLHVSELCQQFDSELETVKKNRPQGSACYQFILWYFLVCWIDYFVLHLYFLCFYASFTLHVC